MKGEASPKRLPGDLSFNSEASPKLTAIVTLIGLHSQQENEDGFKARDHVMFGNEKATVVGTTKKFVYLLLDSKVAELGDNQPTKKDAVQKSSQKVTKVNLWP